MGCERQFANVSLSSLSLSHSSLCLCSLSLPPSLSFINIHCRVTVVIDQPCLELMLLFGERRYNMENSYGMRDYRERIKRDKHKASRLLVPDTSPICHLVLYERLQK